MKFLNISDVRSARERIAPHVTRTPIVQSSLLNQWMGHDIYFKAECLQSVGAFKARGACNTISWLAENNRIPKHIVANSSGNHAQAVAWAASRLGVSATIFMPSYSSQVKIQATASYGASVVLCDTRDIADQKVREASEKEGTVWIPPFNHEQVISGQGTAVLEAIEETGEVDAIFAPCGGGGLLSGSLIASRGISAKTKVIGAEPLAGNDAAQSLRANKIHRLSEAPNTLADGAMTLAVGEITFEYLKQLDAFYEIGEDKMIYWTQWLTHLLKLHIEPTSALAMAGAAKWLSEQSSRKKILIILSGGNIDHNTNRTIWKEDQLSNPPSLSMKNHF
ncbi:serine/threonine dehydratase [Aquimarina hainanensis]|uniref:Serine/threonine dehydratase n=1 Tax=Aquimarina hainanensis TaxID=1578017 RepID=A0ABW5N778_9FLAO|nr:serine/threonine dehydratase [Aquimarina sp. TRL1]QKX03866.1 serine/threonine dehydratase [Aquimarina sp. TRL1]